jgi:hypothetical protein
VTVGWTHAVTAINSVLSLNTPVNLRMDIEMHGRCSSTSGTTRSPGPLPWSTSR